MPDTATRPLTAEERINLLVEETARLRACVVALTAERDRLVRQLQAPFPSCAELARQRMWAHLRAVTARLVGAAGLLVVAVGLAGAAVRGVTG